MSVSSPADGRKPMADGRDPFPACEKRIDDLPTTDFQSVELSRRTGSPSYKSKKTAIGQQSSAYGYQPELSRRFLMRSVALGGLGWLLSNAIRADERTERDKQIDVAISKALDHLSKRQNPSGSWSLEGQGESTAATSLGVMAFLAAGHVPGEGPYNETIQRGIRWVLDQQQPNGMLVRERGHGPMYAHGISTLMLAEVAGMMDDSLAARCRDALKNAVKLILLAQSVRKDRNNAGGWRYGPTSTDSDLSVTGWQLLALRASKNLGCDVPAEHIDAAVYYVKNCSVRNRGFGYTPGSGSSPTRAGTGILCLEICGVHHSPEALGAADALMQDPLRADQEWFFYGVYYCTIGLFQIGGKHWEQGKNHLIPLLLNLQAADGSWSGRQGQERNLGTIYATSLAVLALSVEYQYLPIYQR